MAKASSAGKDFPFYEYLRLFYTQNKGFIQRRYKRLSLKFLAHNDPTESDAYLRPPQFEALEMYIFLKEFSGNKHLAQIFEDWFKEQNGFEGRGRSSVGAEGQLGLFTEVTADAYKDIFKTLKSFAQTYPNYVYALTMGLGKTTLMATSIFYEFLLANKFPSDERFCHNALVFAPDKTVLQSLREIQTLDKSLVVPTEYVNWLDTHLQFHFLDDTGISLNLIDKSKYNIVISNTQKIILKKQHKDKSAGDKLFASEGASYEAKGSGVDGYDDLYDFDNIEDEKDLASNQRFEKLRRLEQLGIYVDEAHHAFGNKLGQDMGLKKSKTSLRLTINELAAHLKDSGTRVVACFNYTGTPYVGNRLLPEVVYAYGLKDSISNEYLKRVQVDAYSNVKSAEFVNETISNFWKNHQGARYEGMLPKLAFFAPNIDDLQTKLRPAVEEALTALGIPTTSILVNVGDPKLTSNDDLREFYALDTPASEKQFILLVNKGQEGWNCRSLFGVALFRKPKSKIFVLQATMRCLRSITSVQQTGSVYLSKENLAILDNELQENFRLSVDDLKGESDKLPAIKIHPVEPIPSIKLKRIHRMYRQYDKIVKPGADLELEKIDTDRYRIIHETYIGIDLNKRPYREDVSYIRNQRKFSELSLVAEVARYLNKPPLEIRRVLAETKDGIPPILKAINEFNETLYDHVIPRLFGLFYELKEFKHEEDYEVELVKKPDSEDGCYYVRPKKTDLVSNRDADEFKDDKDKSFHLDNYCFDSYPERDFFWKMLRAGKIEKIWFTGMLTHGQTEFKIPYIDPISNTLRNYYPDFLVQQKDGTFVIVEIKGENKIDDAVVQAKSDYATQMAVGSGMTYKMIPGQKAAAGF